jgi:hypothetical protein
MLLLQVVSPSHQYAALVTETEHCVLLTSYDLATVDVDKLPGDIGAVFGS